MPAGDADLFFDQVKVVEQPLCGRRDALVLATGAGQAFAGMRQQRFVVGQAIEQQVRAGVLARPVPGGQGTSVLFHLIGAEQLRAQCGFLSRTAGRRAMLAAHTPEPIQNVANVQIQRSLPVGPTTTAAAVGARWRGGRLMPGTIRVHV